MNDSIEAVLYRIDIGFAASITNFLIKLRGLSFGALITAAVLVKSDKMMDKRRMLMKASFIRIVGSCLSIIKRTCIIFIGKFKYDTLPYIF